MKKLTKRELEILILICKGSSSKEIALDLNISSDTVKQHRKSLLMKLSAKNGPKLCFKAAKNNLIPPPKGGLFVKDILRNLFLKAIGIFFRST